ncbi:ECF RNA polymerase sigma factor SigK [Microbacterium lemovicicum]|uniref:ECF RNA polymerase sigma factor SigK n=1 Tax=Microbacterium lemovicicum TaxID=1072463 RepID=A0A3Q9IVR9_9MICO|nr:hypothetical protein [Microbacterium lemovicicum]AZS35475.1 ECF RNA polymerase sigma factor SigK [Microbacterium lemovicicum]
MDPLAAADSAADSGLGALLDGIGAGDAPCLTRLYDALSPKVFGLLIALIPDRRVAETVLADVFVEIWETAAGRPRRSTAAEWMIAITRRRAALAREGVAQRVPEPGARRADTGIITL